MCLARGYQVESTQFTFKTIDYQDGSDSFGGVLIRGTDLMSGRILVRRGIREPGRKRFTIAHEVGHFPLSPRGRSLGPTGVGGARLSDSRPSKDSLSRIYEILQTHFRMLFSPKRGPSEGGVWELWEFWEITVQ